MASPTRELRRLSIGGNMPVSQGGQSVSSDSQSPNDDSEPIQNSSESASEEDDVSTVQATSGITYDLTDLDSDSGAKAVVGLTGEFDLVECVGVEGGYDFQLSEQPRVHVGLDRDTCSCSTFQRQPDAACQHIFWLLDQLHGCAPPSPSNDVPISSDGRSPDLQPAKQLLDTNMESIADQLDCPFRRKEVGITRSQRVRDVMSAFEAHTLPEDFRTDLSDTDQRRTPEQCVVQGDLQATMFRLAVHNDPVYSSLCKAMPPGATAAIYFDKTLEQARRLLSDFDRYALTGQTPADGSPIDIAHVLDTLRLTVDRIHTNILARAPHGTESATKALVTLLEDISARNKDPLDGNRLGIASFDGEDEDQRNLYHQLIGKEDESESFPLLDALDLFSGSELSQFKGRLRTLLHKNEVFPAPRAFILRLEAVVRAAETGTGSGQKRPAGNGAGGNSKRSR